MIVTTIGNENSDIWNVNTMEPLHFAYVLPPFHVEHLIIVYGPIPSFPWSSILFNLSTYRLKHISFVTFRVEVILYRTI